MRDVWLRFGAGVGALVLGAAAIVIVVLVAHGTPGPVKAATPALPDAGSRTVASNGFPRPPANAVVWAREDGPYALALAAVPSTGLLQTSVVNDQGKGVRGLRVTYSVHTPDGKVTRSQPALPCGAGCYAATLPLDRPKQIDVDVAGQSATAVWRIPMPSTWPPPDASALLTRVAATWRGLKTLTFDDHLASDAKHSVDTAWRVIAPDKLAYDVEGGPSAVLIGDTRWDKLPGQGWVRSSALRIHQPVPFWSQAANVHLLGTDTLDGRPVWHLSFFDPKNDAWFELLVAKDSLHTLDLKMTTTAHFMHESYTGFDGPVVIEPPRCGTC